MDGELKQKTEAIPEGIRVESDPAAVDIAYPVNYSDVKLVWELPRNLRGKWMLMSRKPLIEVEKHPQGKWRSPPPVQVSNNSVLIDKLTITKEFYNRKKKAIAFNRMIPGLNIVVPWPKLPEAEEQNQEPEEEDPFKRPSYVADTPQSEVHRKTFTRPSLFLPPIPAGLEFELHNRYSRFKRRKFALVKSQFQEWQRRFNPAVQESLRTIQEIEKKDLNVYSPEQLRIRAANRLVRRARRKYFRRTQLTDSDVLLIATYLRSHIESKTEQLRAQRSALAAEALTPLEQSMTAEERLLHRKERAVSERKQLERRREEAFKRAEMVKVKAKESLAKWRTFEIRESKAPPQFKKSLGKKKKKKRAIPIKNAE
jgi:Large ribosomal subunit protein uL24m